MKRITKEKSNLKNEGEINIYLLLKFSYMPPDLIVLSMRIFICIYINSPSIIIFTNMCDKKCSSKKYSSVIFDLLVSLSLINLLIALQINHDCQKKITSFILLVILLIRFSISLTWGPYVIPSVKLHITNRMSSVVPLMS
jgi:hypothetical protein